MHVLSRVRVVITDFAPAWSYRTLMTLLFMANALCRGAAYAGALTPGDIVVVTQTGGKVYTFDPATGSADLISSGGLLFNPSHVLVDANGTILTAERFSSKVGIVRLDPATGVQTAITKSTVGASLAFLSDSELLVGVGTGQLNRVNLATGATSAITTIPNLRGLQDVDVDHEGRYVVLDFGIYNGGMGQIVRFDPATQKTTTISTGGNLFNPADLVIRASGDFVVSNRLPNSTQILLVDPNSGQQKLITTVPSEGFIALQDENTIVYADFYGELSILRINLTTGGTDTVSDFRIGGPYNVVGVGIYHPVPEPSSLLMAISAGVLIVGIAVRLRSASRLDASKRQS